MNKKELLIIIEDLRHNYKALNEFYDNSVAYGTKIQNELNTLKNDVARYFELASGKYVEDMQVGKISWIQYTKLDDEEQTLKEKLSLAGKKE